MKIWIDLENTPHALFFPPIIERLRESGDEIVVTARDCAQTLELLDLAGVAYRHVGTQPRGPQPVKAASVLARAARLAVLHRGAGIDVSVSHSSRSHVLASALLGIPVVTLLDYEYAALGVFTRFSETMLVPEAIPPGRIAPVGRGPRVVSYPGFKEQVYAVPEPPDPALRERLELDPETVAVVVRPPATRAHYHDPASDRMERAVLDRLADAAPQARTLVLPRYPEQARAIARRYDASAVRVLDHPVPGRALLALADLVVSGGGTMVREAVAMGVPAYSIFQSRMGAVDADLVARGKMIHLDGPGAVSRLRIEKRPSAEGAVNRGLIDFLIGEIRRPRGTGREPSGPRG